MKLFWMACFWSLLIGDAWGYRKKAALDVRGFVALDLLSFRRLEIPRRKDSLLTGIGVIDLKIYARHKNFGIKIKLDLDSGYLISRYNLFEEALVSYTIAPRLKIRAGKGLVPFHRKHWGVVSHSYRDGGHILNPEHFVRDQDQKIMLSAVYGNYRYGMINSLTFWGNSRRIRRDEEGNPVIGRRGTFYYDNNISFETRHQRGLANKTEFFWGRGNALSVAALYYHNDVNPKDSWAFDVGHRFRSRIWEIWWEYTWGLTRTHSAARYPTRQAREHLLQFGGERYMTSLVNVLFNIEGAWVKNQNHDTPGREGNDGLLHKTNSAKAEMGVKFKTSKDAHLTLGLSREWKKKKVEQVKLPEEKAFEVSAALAFWF